VRVLGVDGAKGGWVIVVLDDGRFVESRLVERFAGAVAEDAVVIGVDIPLGETTSAARCADSAARALLGPRRSSVFTPPPLSTAAAADYAGAKRIAIASTGKSISKQAWHLLPKMLDAVPHWRAAPLRIREVSPEASFRAMAGAPLATSKRTAAGITDRHQLLEQHGIRVGDALNDVRGVGVDDVLDAAAVAWSADRIARDQARCLPDPPELDDAGRPVAIWY
jgi:predicted RNase H-like nuclease